MFLSCDGVRLFEVEFNRPPEAGETAICGPRACATFVAGTAGTGGTSLPLVLLLLLRTRLDDLRRNNDPSPSLLLSCVFTLADSSLAPYAGDSDLTSFTGGGGGAR